MDRPRASKVLARLHECKKHMDAPKSLPTRNRADPGPLPASAAPTERVNEGEPVTRYHSPGPARASLSHEVCSSTAPAGPSRGRIHHQALPELPSHLQSAPSMHRQALHEGEPAADCHLGQQAAQHRGEGGQREVGGRHMLGLQEGEGGNRES